MKINQLEKMPVKRIALIKETMEKEKMVTVKRLTEKFKVTYLRIKRYLKKLEKK